MKIEAPVPAAFMDLSRRSGEQTSGAEAVTAFDSYFVGEMLRAASKPLDEKDQLLDGGRGGRMYRDFLHKEIARVVATQGGFGLSDELRQQIDASSAQQEDPE